MLVRDKETDQITVASLNQSPLLRWHFLWERWCIFSHLHFSRNHLFEIDIANSGSDITSLREFQEADVIHLSWINQGMLSLKSIKKILNSGKPVVWTMHDLWPAAGICHYAHGCNAFKTECGHCPLLPGNGSAHDMAYKIWNRKKNILQRNSIIFVACSKWLEAQAKQSSLLVGQRVVSIPNPIDTRIFFRKDKEQARLATGLPANKRIILFVSQRVTDERKGMNYFVAAIDKLVEEHSECKENTCIAILGGHSEDFAGRLALPVFPLGYVSDERQIVNIYNSVDVFVLPSLEDNLPNTIMESMACGVPCVGFRVGGIPEMIDHERNGYVAAFKDSTDLANGIFWTLDKARHEALSDNALSKVTTCYSQNSVAMKYIEVYNQAAAFKRYKL
jgi:glycosyltransferase involved in cell wall biosynthesis